VNKKAKEGATPGAIREAPTSSIRVKVIAAGCFLLAGREGRLITLLPFCPVGNRSASPEKIRRAPWSHRTSSFYCPVKATNTPMVNMTIRRNTGTNTGRKTARAARPLSISFATAVALT